MAAQFPLSAIKQWPTFLKRFGTTAVVNGQTRDVIPTAIARDGQDPFMGANSRSRRSAITLLKTEFASTLAVINSPVVFESVFWRIEAVESGSASPFVRLLLIAEESV